MPKFFVLSIRLKARACSGRRGGQWTRNEWQVTAGHHMLEELHQQSTVSNIVLNRIVNEIKSRSRIKGKIKAYQRLPTFHEYRG